MFPLNSLTAEIWQCKLRNDTQSGNLMPQCVVPPNNLHNIVLCYSGVFQDISPSNLVMGISNMLVIKWSSGHHVQIHPSHLVLNAWLTE